MGTQENKFQISQVKFHAEDIIFVKFEIYFLGFS